MTLLNLMLYLHVLLFGFWIGSDVAVLYLSRFIMNAALPAATRSLFGTIMFRLDTSPTVCLTLMLPVGLTLAAELGLSPVRGGWLALAWAIGMGWLAAMLALIRGTNSGPVIRRWERRFRVLLIVGLLVSGGMSLISGKPFDTPWLAVKVLLFAGVIGASIGIDFAVAPLDPAMRQIVASGSTAELEAQVSGALRRAYPFVYLMYAGILLAAGAALFR